MPAPIVALEEEQRLGVSGAVGTVTARLAALSPDDGYGTDGQFVGLAQPAQKAPPVPVDPAKGSAGSRT